MNDDELNAIEARANAATPGEWEAPLKDLGEVPSFAAVDFYFDHSFEAYPPLGESGPVFVASSKEDADFIAHARADIPLLISEIRRLRTMLAAQQANAGDGFADGFTFDNPYILHGEELDKLARRRA